MKVIDRTGPRPRELSSYEEIYDRPLHPEQKLPGIYIHVHVHVVMYNVHVYLCLYVQFYVHTIVCVVVCD